MSLKVLAKIKAQTCVCVCGVVKAPSLLGIVADISCSLFTWKQRLGCLGKAPLYNLFSKTVVFRE